MVIDIFLEIEIYKNKRALFKNILTNLILNKKETILYIVNHSCFLPVIIKNLKWLLMIYQYVNYNVIFADMPNKKAN